MASPERMGIGWMFWVLGWALLVGCALFVVPSYFLFGLDVALWVGSTVLALSLGLTWLGAEAGTAVQDQRDGRVSDTAPAPQGASTK